MLLGLGVLFYFFSKKSTSKKNGDDTPFIITTSTTPIVSEEPVTQVRTTRTKGQLAILNPKSTYVSKMTGEVTSGMYTRPVTIPRMIAKRGNVWIK